jgi:hypothetical protein
MRTALRRKNLSIAWTDYQKAYDSVPHSSIEKSIKLVTVNSKLSNFANHEWRNGKQVCYQKQSRR